MKKRSIWGFCLCLLASQVFSQAPDSVIQIESTFWGMRYVQGGDHQLSFKAVGVILSVDPEAYQEYNKARTNYVVGTVLGLTGGLLIGYSVGSALTSRVPHWSVAAVGAGILLVAVPLNNGFHRRIRKALTLYNARITAGQPRACSWRLQLQGGGVCLALRF